MELVTAGALGLVLLLLGVTAGLWLGWRWGRRAGLREGRAEAPLTLREEALQRGQCPICTAQAEAPTTNLRPLPGG